MNLIDLLKEILKERKSPLSPGEEKIAKDDKPALKSMQKKYGSKKGKSYFYGMIRNKAKKKK